MYCTPHQKREWRGFNTADNDDNEEFDIFDDNLEYKFTNHSAFHAALHLPHRPLTVFILFAFRCSEITSRALLLGTLMALYGIWGILFELAFVLSFQLSPHAPTQS